MDQKLKRRWVKALLSGEYEQGRDRLLQDGKYCCIGVFHRIHTGRDPDILWDGSSDDIAVQTALKDGGLTNEGITAIADINDAGVPFDMIAGLIDEAL